MELEETLLYGPTNRKLEETLLYGPTKNETARNPFIWAAKNYNHVNRFNKISITGCIYSNPQIMKMII